MQLNTSTSSSTTSSPALAFRSSQSPSSNSSVDRLSLPPELTDYILDYLHDDSHTLFTCSLVSRSFNATCRYHVFSKGIDISSTPEVRKRKGVEGIEGVEDEIEHARKKGKENQDSRTEVGLTTPTYINPASSAASFVRIVLAPSSTVAPFLQELCLVLRPSFSLYSVPPKSAVPANAWLDELLALLPATTVSSSSLFFLPPSPLNHANSFPSSRNKSSTSPKPLPHTHSPYLPTRSRPFPLLPSGFTSKLRTYGEDAGIVRDDIAGEESKEGYGVGVWLWKVRGPIVLWTSSRGEKGKGNGI